ncbi:DMT family transporter [Rehaibacterium terrae]|jgi:quaternary ammonium compound-resistance protein SugE|uniref:Guanidinium exporter n=1 Tax=Rehaibacterium terrae TaxID=1341696 RepID=A0A7W7Y1D7_9GAMM|nr:multidrug efflux SMR transporter [Rehaibacterium terrae]MBB5016311.1 quaternary ammonium compound-resistance protein SugE [Rehaibacterium terrae]
MSWTWLWLAGLLEIAWAAGLKYSHGFSRPLPTVFTLLAMVASFWCLAQAVRALPLGTAYAVWTGIGAVGAFALGVWLFGEALTPWRAACLALIVIGIAGLKLGA